MDVAHKHQPQLDEIKRQVRDAHNYFESNYDRYNKFKRFIFEQTLTDDDITLLTEMSYPQLEFNISEAYISRLLGEFSKQEPDIEVSSDDQRKIDQMQALTVKVVEDHLRHTLTAPEGCPTRYGVYRNLLAGGFDVLKVRTDYASPMSMHQVIKIEQAFDPTLCGFDPLAKLAHKGDGRFCFELFPRSKDDFKEEFPAIDIDLINFRRDFEGFNWSYINNMTEFLIVCEFYKKKKVETKIVEVRDKGVMKLADYEKMLKTWGDLAVPPAIIGKPRKTILEKIVRYRIIETEVIDYKETDFTMLPLIFVDGNSTLVKTPKNGNIRQVTRPYLYNIEGAQKLKNFAGISLANEIENIPQHKFMVAKEALPKEATLRAAYEDTQKARVLVYNSVHEENPELPIVNPIREVQRAPAPPEIMQAFQGADALMQNILGSYDASLGINNNQLSGIAIVEAATQSNAAAMPYVVGYLEGYQRAAQIYVDLMPKYYTTPRTLPLVDKEGKRDFIKINQQDGVSMFFDSNSLNVIVKAGASFQVQKSRTIMMVKEIMGMSPLFAQFIAEKGLPFILDNLEGKGIDQLKLMVDGWLKELQQQKQMAMQQQQNEMQNNPMALRNQIEMMKLQHLKEKEQMQYELDMLELRHKEQKVLAELKLAEDTNAVQLVKAQTERFAKQADIDIKKMDMHHRHQKERIETHHLMTQPKKHND